MPTQNDAFITRPTLTLRHTLAYHITVLLELRDALREKRVGTEITAAVQVDIDAMLAALAAPDHTPQTLGAAVAEAQAIVNRWWWKWVVVAIPTQIAA